MASQARVQDVRAALLPPWKRNDAGKQRGGRWPEGGGPISRRSRFGLNGRTWQFSFRNRMVGRGLVLAMGAWLGRAGGEGAPPDAA